MTTWTRTDDGLEATINGWVYLIEKEGTTYAVYCSGELVSDGYTLLADAKAAADEHAADVPAPDDDIKPGVYMSAIAGQRFMNELTRSFTKGDLMTFMDRSPYDEPDTGAPEPQS